MPRPLAQLLRSLAAVLVGASLATPAGAVVVPAHDHVVVLVLENMRLSVARQQPYIASLIAGGSWFANYYAITHPSQPNYFAMWSGSTQGVTTNDCPVPTAPFSTANLGQACEAAGLSWRAYSENLGYVGATDCSFDGNAASGLYTRKHEPWTYFSNLDHTRERPYTDLAIDIANGELPNLVYIIPNNCHNAHNSSDPNCTPAKADEWLAANVPQILAALGPDGLFVLTFDEDDGAAGNNILTVFSGHHVLTGGVSVRTVTHYTLVRTIADALGLPPPGQSSTEFPIIDVWDFATDTRTASWGRLKMLYR